MSPTDELTVVDAEVVPAMDRDAAHRLDSRIRLLAGNVADNLTKLTDLIAEAQAGQIHLTLGFKSWPAYLASALAKLKMALDADSRRELVSTLTGAGMSQRAIAQAVGVNQATVSRDQKVMHDASPVEPRPNRSPKLERRAAWQQQEAAAIAEAAGLDIGDEELADILVMADVGDDDFEKVMSEARAEGDLSRENVSKKCRAQAPAPVTGIDGKTYGKPKPKRKPKREPAPPPAASFAQLMKRLTDLNRVAAECIDIAEALKFKTDANWCGMAYDAEQQHESASALATGLASLVDGIVTAIERTKPAAKVTDIRRTKATPEAQ